MARLNINQINDIEAEENRLEYDLHSDEINREMRQDDLCYDEYHGTENFDEYDPYDYDWPDYDDDFYPSLDYGY